MAAEWLTGEVVDLTKRGIFSPTCERFGYRRATDTHGKTVQVADYRNVDGDLVMQKVRKADKSFYTIGSSDKVPLFGQQLFRGGGKRLVITEGEIDALSVHQVFRTWPVVSLPLGAGNAARAIRDNLEFIDGYETVVLAFDMDEPGRKAAVECAALIKPGKAHIWEIPMKDANELLLAHKADIITSAVYEARAWRPDGIVSLADIRSKVLAPLEVGAPFPWPGVTAAVFGRRIGDVIGLGAGTGIGKTDVFTQMIAHDVAMGERCGVIYLEQDVGDTGRRIAGKAAGKRFHVPDGSWTPAELEAAWDALEATGLVHFYDSFGAADWPTVRAQMRYMATALGCTRIYLDHLTALSSMEDDENKALARIMAEAAGDAKGRYILHYISHLATPDGKPHEEGGRVMIRHFRGSRAIGFWSHLMFGLERDTQSEDPEARSVTTLRCLKDRATGQGNGFTTGLRYDRDTGHLHEVDSPVEAKRGAWDSPEF